MQYYAEWWKENFWHLGSEWYAKACAHKDAEVIPVNVVEDENGVNWGWQGAGEEEYRMVWPHKGLFDMCFPYGPDAEAKRGKGRIVRLTITRSA